MRSSLPAIGFRPRLLALLLATLAISTGCAGEYDSQISVVRDFLEAARRRDESRLVLLMPSLARRSAEERERIIGELSRIEAYGIKGAKRQAGADIVVIAYSLEGRRLELGIPVVNPADRYEIGDAFQISEHIDYVPLREGPSGPSPP